MKKQKPLLFFWLNVFSENYKISHRFTRIKHGYLSVEIGVNQWLKYLLTLSQKKNKLKLFILLVKMDVFPFNRKTKEITFFATGRPIYILVHKKYHVRDQLP